MTKSDNTTKNKRSIFTFILIGALSVPVQAENIMAVGIAMNFNGEISIGIKNFITDDERKPVASIGFDYYPKTRVFRPNVGVGYLESGSYIDINIGYDFINSFIDYGVGIGAYRKKNIKVNEEANAVLSVPIVVAPPLIQ